ncbi:MAG: hypothetical protein ACRC46_12185 [Thermoguttaceae bacterium]
MSVSSGFTTAMAGSFAAQTSAERVASQDKNVQSFANAQRAAESKEKALKAAGIGDTETESEKAGDRDADGRMPWERRHHHQQDQSNEKPHQSLDPTGHAGKSLDLSG